MKTKSILLLLLIASAMIQVFCVFLFLGLCSAHSHSMFQDQSLVSSKHFLVETEDENLANPPLVHHKAKPKHHFAKHLDQIDGDYWMGKK